MHILVVAGFLVAGTAVAAEVAEPRIVATPASNVTAWIRFENSHQQYSGKPYIWLGDTDLELEFKAQSAGDYALEVLWGAKRDVREAVLEVNGRQLGIKAGGYDGFRWLHVPLPPVSGPGFSIRARRAGLRPGFLAEVRLLTSGAIPVSRFPTADHNVQVKAVPARGAAPGVEAFPEMRSVWDKIPTGTFKDGLQAAGPEFVLAERNARQASESLYRCRRFVDGWLAVADPVSGLIPENLGRGRDQWNGRNNAADNYSYMVLTCAMTDRPLFEGRMRSMLESEMNLTRRLDSLGDWYQFTRRGFVFETVDLDRLVFDNAEYVKDGLIPITELLGPSPWSERMIGIIDDLWRHASIETPFGKLPTLNFEVNGDLLQACSRLYWFTGQQKYLDWALRLGDFYLLGTNHPTRDIEKLSLGDHSCEVINGLSELYVIAAEKMPAKRRQYQDPLHRLYDWILEIGVNQHGMMYRHVNTRTKEHSPVLTDNWGYNYDGLYTAWLIDGKQPYRDMVRKALSNLRDHYSDYVWENGSADGYADSIEGAITLMNREPDETAAEWVDAAIRIMWSKQQPDGIIEGWHGDGNSARTSLMYALWKSQGVRVEPWRSDIRLGAVKRGGELCLVLASDKDWEGRLVFDRPRHREYMRLPMDYPRINQFPEWFVINSAREYDMHLVDREPSRHTGAQLLEGVPVRLHVAKSQLWVVKPSEPN